MPHFENGTRSPTREGESHGTLAIVATGQDAEAEHDLYRHRFWLSTVDQLEALAAELRRYGIAASLIPDRACPFVHINVPGADGDRVILSRRDGERVYEWTSVRGQHPAIDPAGAARRIATQLHREQRLNRTGR